MGPFLIFVIEQKSLLFPVVVLVPSPIPKWTSTASRLAAASWSTWPSPEAIFVLLQIIINNGNKKHPKEYLWEPSFSNRFSPYRLFHTRTDGHKTLGKHKSLMRCLCPLVTRCNFVKLIKLNKYDLSNSKWIEKLAAFGLSFLKTKQTT